MYIDRNRLAEYGLSAGEVAEELEMGLMGAQLGQVRFGARKCLWSCATTALQRAMQSRCVICRFLFMGAESLATAADIAVEGGRNRFSHEAGKRVLVVSANCLGSNIVGAVEAAKQTPAKAKICPRAPPCRLKAHTKVKKKIPAALAYYLLSAWC